MNFRHVHYIMNDMATLLRENKKMEWYLWNLLTIKRQYLNSKNRKEKLVQNNNLTGAMKLEKKFTR